MCVCLQFAHQTSCYCFTRHYLLSLDLGDYHIVNSLNRPKSFQIILVHGMILLCFYQMSTLHVSIPALSLCWIRALHYTSIQHTWFAVCVCAYIHSSKIHWYTGKADPYIGFTLNQLEGLEQNSAPEATPSNLFVLKQRVPYLWCLEMLPGQQFPEQVFSLPSRVSLWCTLISAQDPGVPFVLFNYHLRWMKHLKHFMYEVQG